MNIFLRLCSVFKTEIIRSTVYCPRFPGCLARFHPQPSARPARREADFLACPVTCHHRHHPPRCSRSPNRQSNFSFAIVTTKTILQARTPSCDTLIIPEARYAAPRNKRPTYRISLRSVVLRKTRATFPGHFRRIRPRSELDGGRQYFPAEASVGRRRDATVKWNDNRRR